MIGHLAACELPLYKGLCAPVDWWSSTCCLFKDSCWARRCVWATPPWVPTSWFVFLYFPCTLCFLLSTWKSSETKAEAWRRRWIWSPLWIKQPRRKCAQSCLHKTRGKSGQQQTKTHKSRTDRKWQWEATSRKCSDSIKTWKKTSQNQYNANTSCEPAQNHGIKQKVKRLMLSDLYSSLFPCGAHSQNGQGQPFETRVPGSCAACSAVQISIL